MSKTLNLLQLLVMIFRQPACCDSLREVAAIIDAIKSKTYHLGFGCEYRKLSNMSYDYTHWDYEIFEEFAYNKIDLAILYRIQSIGSMFITRAKEHLKYEIISIDDLLDGDDKVLLHQIIRLTDQLVKTNYPSEQRRIVYYSPEPKMTFTFLTKDFTIKAKDIAMPHK